MEFNPNNNIVRLCLEGMSLEEKNEPEKANEVFFRAWNESTNDFEKFLSAYYIARHQQTSPDKLKWLQTALQFALQVKSESTNGALHSLYFNIAKCYEDVGDLDNTKKNYELSNLSKNKISDKGPFYHGTRANLQIGDLLIPGFRSNYQSEIIMNHIYFTALINGAGLAATLAKGDGAERVYIVEPAGEFENDPNVTDKKFPGNPSRSYRTSAPLKIVGEVTDWIKITPEELKKWREKLDTSKGEIIN